MKLSIIIVNYNGESYIADCLDSILNSKTTYLFEIIVIDNLSTDTSLSILKKYHEHIKIIQNHHNSGFAKANNIALNYALGDYVFFLNNDTVVQPDSLEKLFQLINEDQSVSVLVPKLLNADGSIQTPGSVLGQWRFKSKVPTKIPFAAGAALLIKKQVYLESGGFDNHYFFYNEDLDLCKSLKKAGYDIYYDPRVTVTHFGGLATQFRKPHSIIEGYRGGFYFCQKFYGAFMLQIYRFVILFDIIPKMLLSILKLVIDSSQKDICKAYLNVLKIIQTQDFRYEHPAVNVTVLK